MTLKKLMQTGVIDSSLTMRETFYNTSQKPWSVKKALFFNFRAQFCPKKLGGFFRLLLYYYYLFFISCILQTFRNRK